MHLSDCFEIEESQRTKKCEQMIESIVYLYRNLLKIPDITLKDNASAYKKDLQPKFIVTLSKHNSLDAFIYIVQQSSTALMKRIGITMLEIFYYIFSPFEPVWLFQNVEQDKSFIQSIRERENRQRQIRLSEMSTRHARFDCNIKIVRNFGSGSKIIHNPFKTDWDQNIVPNATKKPKRRKFDPKNASIFPNNHDKEVIVSGILEHEDLDGSIKQVLRNYAIDFVEHVYNTLIERAYEDIHDKSKVPTESEKIYFFVIMGFGLEVFRYHLHFKKANKGAPGHNRNAETDDDYSIANISAALQIAIFEDIRQNISSQIQLQEKSYRKNTTEGKIMNYFSIRLFHAAFYSFLQLLYCIKEMKYSISEATRKNVQILLQKIIPEDNALMIKNGFGRYQPEVHDPKIGKTLAEFIGVFLDLLDDYSKGKVIEIKTVKMIKRNREKEKQKKAKEQAKQLRAKEREEAKQRKAEEAKRKKKEKERARRREERELQRKEKKKRRKEAKKLRRAAEKAEEARLRAARGEQEDGELEDTQPKDADQSEKFLEDGEANVDAASNNERGETLMTDTGDQESTLRMDPPTVALDNFTQPPVDVNFEMEDERTAGEVKPAVETQVVETLEPEETQPTYPKTQTVPTQQGVATVPIDSIDTEISQDALQKSFLQKPNPEIAATIPIETTPEDADDGDHRRSVPQNKETDDGEHQVKKATKIVAETEEGLPEKEESEAEAVESTDGEESADEEEEEEEPEEIEEEENRDGEDEEGKEEIDYEKKGAEGEGLSDEEEDDDEDDDDDDDVGDYTPQQNTKIVNFASQLACIASYRVLDVLLNMIRVDRLEKNDQKVNNAITSFIKKVVNILRADWLFFQIDYLLIFQDILNTKNQKVVIQFL